MWQSKYSTSCDGTAYSYSFEATLRDMKGFTKRFVYSFKCFSCSYYQHCEQFEPFWMTWLTSLKTGWIHLSFQWDQQPSWRSAVYKTFKNISPVHTLRKPLWMIRLGCLFSYWPVSVVNNEVFMFNTYQKSSPVFENETFIVTSLMNVIGYTHPTYFQLCSLLHVLNVILQLGTDYNKTKSLKTEWKVKLDSSKLITQARRFTKLVFGSCRKGSKGKKQKSLGAGLCAYFLDWLIIDQNQSVEPKTCVMSLMNIMCSLLQST